MQRAKLFNDSKIKKNKQNRFVSIMRFLDSKK